MEKEVAIPPIQLYIKIIAFNKVEKEIIKAFNNIQKISIKSWRKIKQLLILLKEFKDYIKDYKNKIQEFFIY